jgi:hypothetical protein
MYGTWYNPPLLLNESLDIAQTEEILRAIYSLLLANFMLVSCSVILFFTFKLIVWFVPNYWTRDKK